MIMAEDWKEKLAALAGLESESLEESEAPSVPEQEEKKSIQTGKLNVVVDKKGRKGKVATIIEGFTVTDEEVESLASELKRKIGTGGSARGGEILLQGDWREKVKTLLKEKGYKV